MMDTYHIFAIQLQHASLVYQYVNTFITKYKIKTRITKRNVLCKIVP